VLNTSKGLSLGTRSRSIFWRSGDASALTARLRASLFRSNTSSSGPEGALNEWSNSYCGLRRLQSEQEQPYRSRIRAPEHSEAGITTSQRRCCCSQCNSAMPSGPHSRLWVTGIVGTHIGKVAVRVRGVLTCRPRSASCRVSVTNTVLCYTGRIGISISQKQALLSALKNRVSAPMRFMKFFIDTPISRKSKRPGNSAS